MRRTTSSASLSLKAAGAVRSELSRCSATSAALRAGRPVVPEKITSVHVVGAEGLVGAFAHGPAHGLDEVGLPAAVRPDDACKAGLDQKLGGLHEGLEAEEPEAGEFHEAGCASLCLSRSNEPARRIGQRQGRFPRQSTADPAFSAPLMQIPGAGRAGGFPRRIRRSRTGGDDCVSASAPHLRGAAPLAAFRDDDT